METPEQAANLASLMGNLGDNVTTAFLVYQTEEGQWVADGEYEDKTFNLSRRATLDDLVGGCAAVQQGVAVQQTAISTVVAMEQRAAAVQRAMQEQQQAAQVSKLIDPSKLRNPKA